MNDSVYDSWYWSIALSHDKCTICFLKDNNCSGKVSQIPKRKAHLKYISEVSWHGAQDNFVGCDSWPVSTGQSHVHEILKKIVFSFRKKYILRQKFPLLRNKILRLNWRRDLETTMIEFVVKRQPLLHFRHFHPFKCLFERLQSKMETFGEKRESLPR